MSNRYLEQFTSFYKYGITDAKGIENCVRKEADEETYINFERVSHIFLNVEKLLVSDELSLEEKQKLFETFINFIGIIRIKPLDYIEKLSDNLRALYLSYRELTEIDVTLDVVNSRKLVHQTFVEKLMEKYLEYLEKPCNELFLIYGNDYITELNNKFISHFSLNDLDKSVYALDEEFVKNFMNKIGAFGKKRDLKKSSNE